MMQGFRICLFWKVLIEISPVRQSRKCPLSPARAAVARDVLVHLDHDVDHNVGGGDEDGPNDDQGDDED